MFVDKAAVVGAGPAGSAIAVMIATAGIPVVLCDPDAAALQAAIEALRASAGAALEARVAKGALSDEEAARELTATLALLEISVTHDGLGDVDLAIEAVTDEPELKRAALAELDAATPGRAILASTTASLSIGDLAGATTRPERVLGLHFRAPVASTRTVEVVEALETAPEAVAAAVSFLAALRRSAIRVQDTPGFLINRVLFAAAGELWRAQREQQLDPAAIDAALVAAHAASAGPYALAAQLGPVAALALATRLREAHGARFELPPAEARAGGAGAGDADEITARFELRALVECCHLLAESAAGAREIDLALAAGAGLRPPLASADARGLAETLARLERAAAQWGEAYAPPVVLRRLVAQGRLGAGVQGFFPAARPDAGEEGPVTLESRGEIAIAWIDNPPANAIGPDFLAALERVWGRVSAGDVARVLVLASANPALFCAGADIKAFATMGAEVQRDLVERFHALALAMERSPVITIAAVNGLAYGGGCELAMSADLRLAGRSANFGQPEIKLGIIPGFGGTQRLSRLIGVGRALELQLTGEPVDAQEAWELGLVNRVVEDHELLDETLAWARRLAAAAPLAVAEIKRLSAGEDLESALAAEQTAFTRVFASEDAREGIAAFMDRRAPRFRGR